MREEHTFRLDGGEELTTMGASWFVSYCYYMTIDPNHTNWDRVSTASSRASVYRRTSHYHKYWLNEVLKMEDNNLNKNSLGLKAFQIKHMAQEILDKK